ncbi:MAG: hypothetical protein LBT23_10635 [Synergistaceae bacterium]|jgi:hypothetical protein|nr:hypothetical protein [Synergistaceae bacterium]
MSRYGLIEQLTSIILLLRDYPQGLSILLGSLPPPTCEDISEIIETVRRSPEPTLDPSGQPLRVDGGFDYIEADALIDCEERFNRIVESSGGWEHINEVTRGWAKKYKKEWSVIADYVRWPKSKIDGISLIQLASEHQISRTSVYAIIEDFPQNLSVAIMYTPVKNELCLSAEINPAAV